MDSPECARPSGKSRRARALALLALLCLPFTPSLAGWADPEASKTDSEPFSDTIERELSILTLILLDGMMVEQDDAKRQTSMEAIADTCLSSGLGTACFALGDLVENSDRQFAADFYAAGCNNVYPNLESCRRAQALSLERSDDGAREQDLLSEGITARKHVLAGNFSQKADALDDLLKLCSEGSGFACTFLADFTDNEHDRRALVVGLKGGCDAAYPDAYACHRRATLYSNGSAGEKDAALALQYAEKGCELGWPDACTLFDSLSQ